MKATYAIVLFGILASPLSAEESDVSAYRLTIFDNAQLACKATVLLNRDVANSFVRASKAPLSEVCECAALLVVANESDEQMSALAKGDEEVVNFVVSKVRERFTQCLRLQLGQD